MTETEERSPCEPSGGAELPGERSPGEHPTAARSTAARPTDGGATPRMHVSRPDQWTIARRVAFLDHLAATCNIAQSAKAVGSSTGGAYALRRRDAAFAEQWRAAIDLGYELLETKVLAFALGQRDDGSMVGDPDAVAAAPIDPDTALKLVRQHQAVHASGATHNERRHIPFAFKHAPIDEVRDALLAKLAARARRRARSGLA
ncbi:hypothetical protein [Sphingomonas sp. PAMC 26605]|uniref:hypothetical protein n=1 Tax=Sphingomonas sp. PAMC 26605 TaxID=1112214 RepID=UPI00026CDCDA|nr:hypothetical protein [Sphingomonas sp. PAMC 26605]